MCTGTQFSTVLLESCSHVKAHMFIYCFIRVSVDICHVPCLHAWELHLPNVSQVHSSMHCTAAVLAYSDHSAPTLPLTEGIPSLFGNSAVVAVPTTTSVPWTVSCANALIRSTACTWIFRSSSISLRMLEAPVYFLEILPSELPPPYLALDIVRVGESCVGESCVPGAQPRLREMCISFSWSAIQPFPIYPGVALLSHPSR